MNTAPRKILVVDDEAIPRMLRKSWVYLSGSSS